MESFWWGLKKVKKWERGEEMKMKRENFSLHPAKVGSLEKEVSG